MTDSVSKLRRTPLYEACLAAGGKMVDFHGWELPVQFEGILAEHKAVREAAGMFDVSHMGRLIMTGARTHAFLEYVTSNKISREPGRGTYSHILNENGGIVDDIIAFCTGKDKYLVVVNSATAEKDLNWFNAHNKNYDVEIQDVSGDFAMVAVQGLNAIHICQGIDKHLADLPRFGIKETVYFGQLCYICRTGYTGEDGAEIMMPPKAAAQMWQFFLAQGVKPCGLGVRDVLRVEAGYLLYGSDVTEKYTPYEANCAWVVKLDKKDFIGKPALLKQKEEGAQIKLTSFKLKGPGVPREGNKVKFEGREIGFLTSGTYSPQFKGIGKGYVVNNVLKEGDEVEIISGGRSMPAEVVKSFYKNRV
ncbi:MAG: glycine cleavage system aminomethyltransferase GcvT [Elusimicrobium sp.]|jgi:aminomethyltransferase|nr:glycine cleavage system aminomethyltransferase GcvT [Elusimicrobium sp.]